MNDGSIAAPPQPPSSPAGVAQPAAAPQQPSRRRLSDMEMGLEQANERRETRAVETEQRLAKPDPRQAQPDLEPELPALPEAEPDGELEPELPAQADQAALQAQDKELLDATKAWLEGEGEMPEAFDKQMVEWADKTTGAPRRMTIAEMKEGVLRQSDYQRNMNELRNVHQQVQWRDQANNQFWQQIREPLKLLEEMENRGYDEVFHQAAVEHSNRRMRMKQVAEAAGYALMKQYGYAENHPDVVNAVRQTFQQQQQARKLEIENRRLQQHNQMLAAQQQQQQQQQQRGVRLQDLRAQINPLIPTALKSAGMRNTATNQDSIWKHLVSHVTNLPNWDGNIRRAHVIEAAKMAREEHEDLAHARAPKRPQQSKAMPPSRLSSSGNAQPTEPTRKRLSDMQNDGRFGFG